MSDWKIECDALTDEDWETLAAMVSRRVAFKMVLGVPRGGHKLRKPLMKYIQDDPTLPVLIVDDVLTTGRSMEALKATVEEGLEVDLVGYVVFARGECPPWVRALFTLDANIGRKVQMKAISLWQPWASLVAEGVKTIETR